MALNVQNLEATSVSAYKTALCHSQGDHNVNKKTVSSHFLATSIFPSLALSLIKGFRNNTSLCMSFSCNKFIPMCVCLI
jgi:hypothetical protein